MPRTAKDYILKKSKRKKLKKLYDFDRNRYINSAYELNDAYSFNNLRSKITFHYHSIEKGLSNINFRYGFGKNAFNGLFIAMDKFIANEFDTEDRRFQQAITVIKAYVDVHNEANYDVQEIEKKLEEFLPYYVEANLRLGGSDTIYKENLPNFKEANFKELALNRNSIRDFGTQKVEKNDIDEVIDLAIKTPSVCNRQPNQAYVLNNPDLISKSLEIQGGFKGHGKNIQYLMVVTSNREYMNGPHERNQTYIDGGMFLMSLLYALTYKNIASCVLNADFNITKEKSIRKLLDISFSEDIIAFIAIGSYADEYKIANSPRDSRENILVYK